MYCTNRKSTRIMLGGEFVDTVLKVGGGAAGEPLKCPEKMRLVVVIMVHIVF